MSEKVRVRAGRIRRRNWLYQTLWKWAIQWMQKSSSSLLMSSLRCTLLAQLYHLPICQCWRIVKYTASMKGLRWKGLGASMWLEHLCTSLGELIIRWVICNYSFIEARILNLSNFFGKMDHLVVSQKLFPHIMLYVNLLSEKFDF